MLISGFSMYVFDFESKSSAMDRSLIGYHIQFLAIGPDSLTTTEFHQFFTQDAKLIFANNKEIPNLNALKAFFEPQFPLFESMKHDVLDLSTFLFPLVPHTPLS